MDETADVQADVTDVSHGGTRGLGGRRLQGFLVFLAALSLAFAFPLFRLFAHAAHNELYSHIFLIPLATLYLATGRLREIKPPLASHWYLALAFAVVGAGLLGVYLCRANFGWAPATVDQLALTTGSYLAFATSGLLLFLGVAFLRAILFPWALLLFLVPFPAVVEYGIEIFFQRTSAEMAHWLMSLAGLPFLRDGLFFRLPGILLEVARECSGIRSSLVLFITSLVGGMMLLQRPSSRAFLALAVIPLAILRNSFRILTVAWLCVHVGPEMIHSPIHRRGGPIFFLLSLIPFFALLLFLKWIEKRRLKTTDPMTRNKTRSYRRNLLAMLCSAGMLFAVSGCLPGGSKAARLERADGYYKAGELERAEIEYLNILKADPKDLVAVARLGIIFQAQGKWPRAVLFLQRARAMDTNNVDLRRALALTYLGINERGKAREEAELVLQKAPADEDAIFVLVDTARSTPEVAAIQQRLQTMSRVAGAGTAVHIGLGEIALKQADLRSAESEIKKAIEMAPGSSVARMALANLYFAQTNRVKAEEIFKAAAEAAAPRSFVKLKWADHLMQEGRMEESRQFLEGVVKQAAGYVPPLLRLGQIALEQRRFEEGNAVVARVVAAEPLSLEGRLLGGKLKLAQGQVAKAVEDFERLSGAYPRVPMVFYQLAVAQFMSGQLAKAVSSLNQAVSLDPDYAEAVLMLAELNLRRGDPGVAISSLSRLLAKRPNLAQAYYVLADAHRIKGTAEQAIPQYRRLEQLSPKDPRAPFMLGLTFLQLSNTNEARQAFERAVQIEPDFLGAVTQLAELDLDAGRSQAGLDRVQRYVAIHTNDAAAYSLLAQIHLARRDEALAEEALRKTIELNPDFAGGYVGLARIMAAGGRLPQAIERLEALLVRNPKDVGALMMLGTLHEKVGDTAKARDSYERLLKVNPRFGPALNNAAQLYSQRLGDPAKALQLARRAHELSPYDPYAADTLGWILFQNGEFANALVLLQESAQKLSAEGEVLFHLGMVHYMIGNEAPAKQFLERALHAKQTEFEGRAEAQARLAILNLDPSKADAQAATMLKKRLEERPDDPVALARMVAVLVRNGQPDQAIGICEQALKANAGSVPATMQLARLYAESKRNSERALEYARAARKLAPEDPEVAYAMGKVAYQCRDIAWAYGVLLDAARARADQADVLFSTAMAAYGVGRVAEAESLVRRALEQSGGFAQSNQARRFLAMTALWREPAKIGPASAKIGEELRADPNFVPTLMVVGLAHERARNPDEARKAYERALSVFPTFTPAMKELARLLVDSAGDTERAFELAGKARDGFPDDPDVARTFGMAAYRRSDFAAAARALKEASRKRQTDANLFFHLGMAHSRLKQAAEARQALGRALELDPNASFATEARMSLADLK